MLKLIVKVKSYFGKVISGIALISIAFSMFAVCSYSSANANANARASATYHSNVSQSDSAINPYNFLRNTLDSLNAQIKNSKVSYDKSPKKLYKIVKSIVLPNIAVNQLAGTVVGRKNWVSSTKSEKKEFIAAFSELLTRSYSTALLKVSDYEIKLRPLRGSSWKKMHMVRIAAKIVSKSSGSASNAAFYLERSGDTWKIYDLAVEGISIVKNFREQFASFSSLSVLTKKINAIKKAATNS